MLKKKQLLWFAETKTIFSAWRSFWGQICLEMLWNFQASTMWQMLSNTGSHLIVKWFCKSQQGDFTFFIQWPLSALLCNNLYNLIKLKMHFFLLMQAHTSNPLSLCSPSMWLNLPEYLGRCHEAHWKLGLSWGHVLQETVGGWVIILFFIRADMSSKEPFLTPRKL